jgi:hypothetical protein
MGFGSFGGMESIISRYLASPDGQEATRKYLASPEGIAMIKNFISTPEGQKTAITILPALLDGLNIPPEVKETIAGLLNPSK